MDPVDATFSLQQVALSRQRLADTAEHSFGPARHAAFALLSSGFIANAAVPIPWMWTSETVLMLSIVLIYRWNLRRSGMFISGYRRGKTRALTFAMLGVTALLNIVFYISAQLYDNRIIVIFVAIAEFILAYGFSVMWKRTYFRELRSERPTP